MSDPFTDILAAAAEMHRADELRSRVDDMLVDGRLLLTESAFETLKRQAVVADGDFGGLTFVPSVSVPPWALLSVLVIPDDGQVHAVGNGKVAIVSPLDHKTIMVMPAELADPVKPPPIATASRHGNQCAEPDCILDAGHPDHHESQHGASWRTVYTTDWEPEPADCPEMDGCTIHDADGNLK